MAKPTLCGAQPTVEDVGRDEGAHFVSAFAPIVRLHPNLAPRWMREAVETLCPECSRKVEAS